MHPCVNGISITYFNNYYNTRLNEKHKIIIKYYCLKLKHNYFYNYFSSFLIFLNVTVSNSYYNNFVQIRHAVFKMQCLKLHKNKYIFKLK